MAEQKGWTRQEDGTLTPDESIMNQIREAPEKYPTAAQDLAEVTGRSVEEVQAILDNPYENNWAIGKTAGVAVDLAQGLTTGVGTALDKVGFGILGDTEAGKTAQEWGKSLTETAESWDPKFSTEKGFGESLIEGIGQAAPAIAGTVAATGAAPILSAAGLAGLAVGAGIGYFTIEDGNDALHLLDKHADGWVPDFMIIDKEVDDLETQRLKGMASMLVTEGVIGLGLGLVGKIYRATKGGTEVTEEIVTGLVDDAVKGGMPPEKAQSILDMVAEGAESAAASAQLSLGKAVRTNMDKVRPTPKAVQAEAEQTAVDLNNITIQRMREGIKPRTVQEVFSEPDGYNKAFKEFQNNSLIVQDYSEGVFNKRPTASSDEILEQFDNEAVQKSIQKNLKEVFDAGLVVGEDSLVRTLKALDNLKNTKGLNRAQAVGLADRTTREILSIADERTQAVFDLIAQARKNGELMSSDDAVYKFAADLLQDNSTLYKYIKTLQAETQATGTSVAITLASRRNNWAAATEGAINDWVKETAKESGLPYSINDLDSVIYQKMFRAQIANGDIDNKAAVELVEREFADFKIHKDNALESRGKAYLKGHTTKEQREVINNSVWKMIQDSHAAALLSQFSTAGTEIFTNVTQGLFMPMAQIIGKSPVKNGKFVLGENIARARAEYIGYKLSYSMAKKNLFRAFRKGKDVTDDMDIMENGHSLRMDYDTMRAQGKTGQMIAARIWKGAADVSIASGSFTKTSRAYGIAFADRYSAQIKAGLSKKAATEDAMIYAVSKFDPNTGKIIDPAIQVRVAQSAWQSPMDNRYLTGRIGAFIEAGRNSSNGPFSTVMRGALPFFRVLVNIGGHSLQGALPVHGSFLRGGEWLVNKGAQKLLKRDDVHLLKAAKFLDDFSGRNGSEALMAAQARQNMGIAMMASSYMLLQSGDIEITAPNPFGGFNAQKAAYDNKPSNSIIIGGTAIDLTRGLPFTAPLIMAGLFKQIEDNFKLDIKGGEYQTEPELTKMLLTGLYAYGTMYMSLMSDLSSMRGVTDTFDAITSAVEDGDPKKLGKVLTNYGKGFTPGIVKMYGKNRGALTGNDADWDMYRGESFIEQLYAGAGFAAGYKKLDFVGRPIRDGGRGLDPFNAKPIHTDPLTREYGELSRDADFGVEPGMPDRVFDKKFWAEMGLDKSDSFVETLVGAPKASITNFKLTNGLNAWEAYRRVIYEGTMPERVLVTTGAYADRNPLPVPVDIRKGENFHKAMDRLIQSNGYQSLDVTGRRQVWQAVFGKFKKDAKAYVGERIVMTPEDFKDSKWGSPINQPTSLADTKAASKVMIGNKKGTLENSPIEDVFAIE